MTPSIAAVLFDYGLVLTGPPSPAAWTQMLQVTGLSEAAFHEAYWAPRHAYDRGAHTGSSYWQAVGSHAGQVWETHQITALLEADIDLWTQPNPPMIAWAQRLQAAGTRTGILSNLGDAMAAGALARLPWLAGFDHHVWSHSLRLAKPEAAIYAASVAGLGVPAAQILFVDDRADNIAGALAAGLQAIRYIDQISFEQELEDCGLGELWRTGQIR